MKERNHRRGGETAAEDRKSRSHEKIQGAAARLLRRDGIGGASVRRVMAAAGMTGGGFYAHFPSKVKLTQEAFSWAAREKRRVLSVTLGDARGASYIDRFLRAYLTPDHRDDLQTGCPYAALLSELPRSSRAVRSRVREEFSRGVKAFAERLQGRQPSEGREKAILVLCLAFGALAMSRTLADFPEGNEVLDLAGAAAKYFKGVKSRS